MGKTFTNYNNEIDFEIIVDDLLIDNGMLLSLANDFESYKWRDDKFMHFILNNLQYAALSAKERDSMIEKPYNALAKAISNLNLKEIGGEIGEIFLYGIMQQYYQALPIVPKIFYKQNPKDEVKGADSIHITINDNICYLWLGESKFYTNLKKAFKDALESVKILLSEDKLKRENSMITNLRDLDDIAEKHNNHKSIIINFKNFLESNYSIDDLKKILHIPISIIYQCEKTANTKELNADYKKTIKEFHENESKNFLDEIIQELEDIPYIEKIQFHIILFPVPDKNQLVKNIINKMKAIK